MKRVTLALIFVTILASNCESSSDFIPTKEWQEIAEGQRVPAGLHYRINFETGKKEAKILEEDNESDENKVKVTTPILSDQNVIEDDQPSEVCQYSIARRNGKFHILCRAIVKDFNPRMLCTLDYLIIIQDAIIMQAGNFPKINKSAGCNKAMQVGIFQKSIVKKSSWLEIFGKLINVQDVI